MLSMAKPQARFPWAAKIPGSHTRAGCCDQVTHHIPFNDVAALEKELSTGIYQGFIVEPIQGEGGVFVATDEFMQKARELCDKYDTIFVCDEIQTGCCRTGKFWASEW